MEQQASASWWDQVVEEEAARLMTIGEWLDLQHEVDSDPQPRFYFSEEPVSTDCDLPAIDEIEEYVTVIPGQDEISWRIDLPEDTEGDRSTIGSNYRRETKSSEHHKIRHELVCEAISIDSTDIRFGDMFPPLKDESDNLTPDFMFRTSDNVTHIVEVTTTRSNLESSALAAYKQKLFKYCKPASDRQLDNIITLNVIVVTPNRVYSTVLLPQRVVNDLIFRMQLSIVIEQKLLDMGYTRQQTGDITERERMAEQIEYVVKGIERLGTDEIPGRLVITDDFRDSCMRDPDVSAVHTCFQSSIKRTAGLSHIAPDPEPAITSYFDKLRKTGPHRHDQKPVIGMPLVIASNINEGTLPSCKMIATSDPKLECITEIWDCAMSQLSYEHWIPENVSALRQEALETDQNEIENRQQARKKNRRKYHRVNMKSCLRPEVLKYLQKDGIMAKKAQDQEWMKARKLSQKQPFSYKTPVNDIDHFISTNTLSGNNPINTGEKNVLKLLKKANELTGNRRMTTSLYRKWMETDLYRAMDLITDIATELAISIKQNVSSNEMILKKLRYHDCYILIRPTNSSSHLFYSLMFVGKPKIMCGLPFRTLHKVGSTYLTDFCSVRADKLSNYLIAGPRLIALASFWCDYYGIADLAPESCETNLDFLRSLNLSILISLENKASTEEVLTTTRYMYMEFFRSTVGMTLANPMKVLDKFPVIIRSRLTLWCVKQIISNCQVMIATPPKRGGPGDAINGLEDETIGPEDSWSGLINLITGEPIPSATQAVNLMYLGYLKDKNETAQENVEWKLVEKIVEEELKLNPSRMRQYYGAAEPNERPLSKEFNMDCVLYGCKLMEGKLKKKLGTNWRGVLKDEIFRELSRHFTHEIATLKASSKIDHKNTSGPCTKVDAEHITRIKVIEAIASKLDKFGLNPMEKLNDFLKFCEDTANGVICDLFKKNQHGGLREIYVLTIESRILQLFIETISRVLCSQFDEETLTHPKNKLAVLDEHKTLSAKISKAKEMPYVEFCSSCDKTRWNQNFTMPAMSVPLFRLCDPVFHNAIQRIMNLWASKLIKLPPGVCKLLMSGTTITSAAYKELYSEFHYGSKKEFRLMRRKNGSYISPTTGMMQGILHYTSSLMHLCFLHSAKDLILRLLKKKQGPRGMFHRMSFVCSSDDSGLILTLFCSNRNLNYEEIKVTTAEIITTERFLHALSYFCEYFDMKESVKSTVGLISYIEYNSEFLLKNTIGTPTIKFVAASSGISESESFVMRFHEQYNLISALFCQGFPSLNTHLVQISQAILHYKTMGSSSSALFGMYTDMILTYPDCVHGFFLLDDELACGFSGFSYSRWRSVTRDPNLFKSLKIIRTSETEVGPDGSIVDSLNLKHGGNTRWLKLLDRISTGEIRSGTKLVSFDAVSGESIQNKHLIQQKMEEIDSKPELFFNHPVTSEDVRIKLMMKATMPGVSKSLSKGNPLMQSFSSTAYSLYSHCFTRTTLSKDAHDVKKEVRKYSILSSLQERIRYNFSTDMEDEELPLEMVFPLLTRYTEISEVLESYRDCELLFIGRLRQKKTEIRIQSPSSQLPLSLVNVCRKWWFGHALHVSNSVFKRCRSIYIDTFPWLRSDFASTLEASPFSSYHELYGFIASQQTRSRHVLRIGPSCFSNSLSGQVSLLVKKSPLKNYILSRPADSITRSEDKSTIMSNLELALMIPLKRERERQVKRQLGVIGGMLRGKTKELTKLEKKMDTICRFQRGEMTAEQLSDELRESRMGMLIQYNVEQRKIVDQDGNIQWMGYGECVVNDEGINMRVELQDRFVTKIITSDWPRLHRNPGILREFFTKLNVKPCNIARLESCLARFDGFNFTSESQSGTPIFQQRDFYPIKIDLNNAFFQIRHQEMGIYNKSPTGRITNILVFKCSGRLKRRVISRNVKKEFWDAWVSCDISEWLDAAKIIKAASLDKTERKTLKNWVSTSFKRRLISRGLYGSYLEYMSEKITMSYGPQSDRSELSEEEDDADTMAWLEDQYDQAIQLDTADIGLSEVETQLPLEEYIDFAAEEGQEIALIFRSGADALDEIKDVSVIKTKDPDCFSSHPVWDGFIEKVLETDPLYFSKIIQGILPQAQSGVAEFIMNLLDIKQTTIERDIAEQLMGLEIPECSDAEDEEE